MLWQLQEMPHLSLPTFSSYLDCLLPALHSSPFSPPQAPLLPLWGPPNTAGPLSCPLVAAEGVAMGRCPPRLAPSHLPWHLPWLHLGSTSHMGVDAESSLLADTQTELEVTLCDMSPRANKSTPRLFYQSVFLSASVIADCI